MGPAGRPRHGHRRGPRPRRRRRPARRRCCSPASRSPRRSTSSSPGAAEFLTDYQDAAWADRYEQAVRRVAAAETARVPGHDQLALAVARNLFKLMSYKDEYEVARLYADPAFRRRLDEQFEGDYTFKVNLAPQILNRRDRNGRARKIEIPSSVAMPAFKALARSKRLRGTKLDVFGRTEHRRAERARIDEYTALLDELARTVTPENHHLAVQLAELPDTIRGYDTDQGRDRRAGQGEGTAPDPRVSGGDALALTTSPARPPPDTPRGSHAAADCSSFVDHDSGVVFGVVDGVFDVVVGAGGSGGDVGGGECVAGAD